MQTLSRFKSIARAVLISALAGGCAEPTEPGAPALEVRVVTSGAAADLDPDGYSITIGNTTYPVPANGTITIPDAAPGIYPLVVDGIAANCSRDNASVTTIRVSEGRPKKQTIHVVLSVTCSPDLGTVRITTVTSGPDQDVNGYTLSLRASDGTGTSYSVATNGMTVGQSRSGEFEVIVEGIAANCRLDGQQREPVTIEHGRFKELSVRVVCVANGSIAISARTSGEHPDPNGYAFTLLRNGQHLNSRNLASNATVVISGLTPGEYEVVLYDIAIHCEEHEPVTATVRSAEVTDVTFNVPCKAPFEIAFVAGKGNAANIARMTTDGRGRSAALSEAGQEADPAWSPDGRRIAFTKILDRDSKIVVADADGRNRVELPNENGLVHRPDWSPDGGRIAFVKDIDGNSDVYIMNADGSSQTRLTTDAATDTEPAWSPDGTRIAFIRRFPDLSSSIYLMNADGSGEVGLTTGSSDHQPAWSPDGTRIVFARHHVPDFWTIHLVQVSDGKTVALYPHLFSAADPAWSPDGKAIAFSGALGGCDYGYYYYCEPQIHFLRLDGTLSTLYDTGDTAVSPAWRPRP